MGSVFCCLQDECEEYANPNSSIYRNCICLQCFLQNFLHLYTVLFRRQDHHVLPSSIQETSSLTSRSSFDNSLSDMHRLPPRPLPYDAGPRYFQSQEDGLVSKREKGSSHSHEEETEPLRSNVDNVSEYVGTGGKWDKSIKGEELIEYSSRSSSNLLTTKTTQGFGVIYVVPEDEDVCPTCLEEYTAENPKIVTKCSHDFHLGCIYEWMERSESCPVCGKVMLFDETT